MTEAAKKQSPIIMPDRMGLAEHKRQDWVADLTINQTLDDVMLPEFWAHMAGEMHPGDHIEVRAADFSWVAELIVSFCERTYAKVVLVNKTTINVNTDVPVSSVKHEIKWRGPHEKYSVVRRTDGAVIKSQLDTKEAASAWMIEHERTK